MRTAIAALLIVLLTTTLSAQKLLKSSAPSVVNGWNFADINAVNATLSNDGVFADYRRTNSAGLEWPRGSGKTAVYASGLWIIGRHHPTDSLRASVMNYISEYQPGKILSTFNTATNAVSAADNPALPQYRLYKAVRGQPVMDAFLWPAQMGAPYKDLNGNGTWDPFIDSPVRWGDQALWTVANDITPGSHFSTSKSKPLGLELQTTVFGYDVPGPLSNVQFIRYKFINRSDADCDSVFIGYWSDIDMGDANDDMIASDTLRSMYFVYNVDNDDAGSNGYGATPPATGFMLLQGPMVHTGAAGDTARREGMKYPSHRNIPMTSFLTYFGGGGGVGWVDPPLGGSLFTPIAYGQLKGILSNGTSMTLPSSSTVTKYAFSGDPVTGTGWNHGATATAQDVRGLSGSGPFTLAQGDTQEVVIAYLIAKGTDRLNSIVKLREAADAARAAYLSDFTLASLTVQGPNTYRTVPNQDFAFQRRVIGEPAETLRYRVMNIGSSALQLQCSAFTQGVFTRTTPSASSVSVPPGTFIDLSVAFNPSANAAYTDSLVITTDDTTDARFVLPVTGTGIPLTAAAGGTVYASTGSSVYSVNSGNGQSTLLTPMEAGLAVGGISVRPVNGELYGMWSGGIVRLSAGGPYHIKLPHSLTGYNYTGGMAFVNDSLLAFAADSVIARMNIRTGAIDTVHRFLTGHRVQSLAYHPGGMQYYYSIRTTFGTIPDTADAVFRLNASTKEVTRLGRTLVGTRIRSLLSDKNGKLYALVDSAGSTPAYLITVNTSNGRGTLIGTTGVAGLLALALDPTTVAGVRPEPGVLPSAFALHQNFPNPFNPSTVITYDVPVTGEVRLEVFDMLGRKAATLVSDVQRAGRYSVRADATALGLSSGVYIYALRSGSFSSARKMSIVK